MNTQSKRDFVLTTWRPLVRGQRVETRARWWNRGQTGTVVERLDCRIDGMGRYAVRMDRDDRVADFVRMELKCLRDQRTGRLSRVL